MFPTGKNLPSLPELWEQRGKKAVVVPIIPPAVYQVEAEVWRSGNLAWPSSSSSSAALHQEAISSRRIISGPYRIVAQKNLWIVYIIFLPSPIRPRSQDRVPSLSWNQRPLQATAGFVPAGVLVLLGSEADELISG